LSRDLVAAGLTAPAEVTGRSLKAGLKWATKIGARAAVILGEQELAEGVAIVRDLVNGEQETVSRKRVASHLARLLEAADQD
jgi:histidyl-tRNA synthetase